MDLNQEVYDLYIDKNKSIPQIAKKLRCSYNQIKTIIKNNTLPIEKLSNEKLFELYIEGDKTIRQIAKIFGCIQDLIQTEIKRYNLDKKKKQQINFEQKKKRLKQIKVSIEERKRLDEKKQQKQQREKYLNDRREQYLNDRREQYVKKQLDQRLDQKEQEEIISELKRMKFNQKILNKNDLYDHYLLNNPLVKKIQKNELYTLYLKINEKL